MNSKAAWDIIDRHGGLDYAAIREAELEVEFCVNMDLNENQFAAVVSFVESVGSKRFRKSRLKAALNRYPDTHKKLKNAAQHFYEYYPVKRRKEEAELFLTPCLRIVGGKDV